jgi:predicted RNase H-like nuclease (RuvC/YqgF family)
MNWSVKKGGNKVRRGDKFKVINTKNINGWVAGEIVISEDDSTNSKFVATSASGMSNQVQLGVHVELMGTNKDDLKSRIGELEKEGEDLKARLEFMEKKGIDELDEQRYVRYIMLREINKDSPAEDKEEVINDILSITYG